MQSILFAPCPMLFVKIIQMKNLIKLISLLLIAALFSSCDEKVWQESDLNEVPIYSISEMTGGNALHALEIYPDQDLVIEFEKATALESFDLFDFEDASTSENYELNYTLKRPALTADKIDTALIRYYEISGTKIDSLGSYATFEITASDDTVKLSEGDLKIFLDTRLY